MTAVNTCPRCGGTFSCGMHDTAPCACTGLQLTPATLNRLRGQYTGCLCLACLREEGSRDAEPSFQAQSTEGTQG